MLFKIGFFFFFNKKSKRINNQLYTQNTQNYFYLYVTLQLKRKKHILKSISKQTQKFLGGEAFFLRFLGSKKDVEVEKLSLRENKVFNR
jgi:hypothetical protein